MSVSKLNKIFFDISDELTENIEDSKSYLLEHGMNPENIAKNGISSPFCKK